jgi:phosphoenolpyruvate carboxylase
MLAVEQGDVISNQIRVSTIPVQRSRRPLLHANLSDEAARMFEPWLGDSRSRKHHRGLNLVVAAIVLWNTVYLERAVQALRNRRQMIPEALLEGPASEIHVVPLFETIEDLEAALSPQQKMEVTRWR